MLFIVITFSGKREIKAKANCSDHSANNIGVTIPKGVMENIINGSVTDEELDKILPRNDNATDPLRHLIKSFQNSKGILQILVLK